MTPFFASPLGQFFARSLVRRAVAIVVLSGVVGWAASGVFDRMTLDDRRDKHVEDSGGGLVALLAEQDALTGAVAQRQWDLVGGVLRSALVLDDDLLYIALYDGSGKVLAQAVDETVPVHDREHVGELTQHGPSGFRVHHFSQRVAGNSGEGREAVTLRLGLCAWKRQQQTTRGQRSVAVLILVAAALGAGLWTRGMSRQLSQEIARVLPREASALGGDELSRLSEALKRAQAGSSKQLVEVESAMAAQSAAASEIASLSAAQGESVARHAVAVTETGSTVAELRQTFQQAAEQAQAVIDLAKRSEESTALGKQSVEESVSAMEQIRDQVMTIRKTFVDLVDRTTQIGTIVDAVSDLTEQSNVLALNAAVEAAKAGEHGRGFAVVAREVRTLAERSKESTGQIRSILQDIEKASKQAMHVIEEGTRRTKTGVELAERAGQSIAVLDRAIAESSRAAQQIAASTRQQAQGVDHIWEAVNNIDRATTETAQGLQKLERSAESLKELSSGVIKFLHPN